jgi:hypothetical protein
MKKVALVVLLMFVTFTLFACGGGGGGDGGSESPQVLSGQFVDAPVEGLSYTAGTTTGKTTSTGTFQYKNGETVTFKVGDIVLGTSQGKAIVTPLDLARNAKNDPDLSANDQMVVNMVRFLMTITGSNSNSQTFTIDQTTFNNCIAKAVDFDQATGTFSLPGGITNNSLTSAVDAETHFNNTLAAYRTKFSSAYLNGKTLFEVSPEDADNNLSTPDVYLKGTLKFTSSSAGVGDDSNFLVNPTAYNFTYTVDAKGILQLSFTGVGYTAYLKIVDENADRLAICWEDTYAAADSCLVENEYLYFDKTKAQSFIDSNLSTDIVVDSTTTLMWQKADDNTQRNWNDAVTYCNNLSLGGYADWRLPSKVELHGLNNSSVFNQIQGTPFSQVGDQYFGGYWSSTSFETDYAWHVFFSKQGADGYASKFGWTNLTRCVRP